MMKSDKFIKNSIMVVITAALISAAVFAAASAEAFAAEVSGTYEPKDSSGQRIDVGETTYRIWRVGGFDGGLLKLYDRYSNVGVGLNYRKADFGEEDLSDEEAVKWREAWMTSAETLSNYLKDDDIAGTYTGSDGRFRFTGLDNGLYLITGSSSSISDGTVKTYWWPRPMYARVLNDDPELMLKPDSSRSTSFIVRKTWENMDDAAELVKPESVRIKIFYGGTGDDDLVATEELNDENNWTYTWDAEEDQADPSKWYVQEEMEDADLLSFSVQSSTSSSEAAAQSIITLTNTYDRYSLEIEKVMQDLISHGDASQAQSFVFEIRGYAGNEEVFHRFAGIAFAPGPDISGTALVKNIPRNVDRIVVKETYAGNYKPDSEEKEAELVKSESDPKGIWKVSFTNTVPGIPDSYDTGVINKYSITGDGAFSFEKAIGR